MTDADPRLEAAKEAYLLFREEVMPHADTGQHTAGLDNATAPVMGADPPDLEEFAGKLRLAWLGPKLEGYAERSPMWHLSPSQVEDWRRVARTAWVFANAQPPNENAIRMAEGHFLEKWPAAVALPTEWRTCVRAALIAAYKARGGA